MTGTARRGCGDCGKTSWKGLPLLDPGLLDPDDIREGDEEWRGGDGVQMSGDNVWMDGWMK